MLKIIMIVGEPCVGKSTVIRELLNQAERRLITDDWTFKTQKWISYHWSAAARMIVMGDYRDPNQKYPGTDRLSMAVQPHFIAWLDTLVGDWTVVIEGDRLGNKKCLDALRTRPETEVTVVWLQLDPYEMTKRRSVERRDQNPVFWRSRNTKIKNLTNYAASLTDVKRIGFAMYDPTVTTGVVNFLLSQDL